MHNQSKREKLIAEYRELLKNCMKADTKEEQERFSDLAHRKHQEILMEQFGGDKNIGRFNEF